MKGIRKPRKPLWECHLKGHKPMAEVGESLIYMLDGVRHAGRICSFCKGMYFEVLGETEGRIIKV